jgi:Tol biopolymer transport system component
MAVVTPPRAPRSDDRIDRAELEDLVEALIEEARRRARRRRLLRALAAGSVALVGLSVFAVFDRTGWSLGSSSRPAAKAGAAGGASRSRIAFSSGSIDAASGRRALLYVVDANGAGKRLLVRGAFGGPPTWSPDGRKIAFLSARDHSQNVYVLDLDAHTTHRVTRHPANDLGLDWSPDGSRIVFARARGSELFVANADGSGEHRLCQTPCRASAPAWSPDGLEIAFKGTDGLYVIKPDGSALRRLESGVDHFRWSPDGRRIAFVNGLGIYVMNADGSAKLLLGQGEGPSWSPDGSRIAFAKPMRPTTSAHPTNQNPEIYAINADGTGLTRLTNNHVWDQGPDWSPDGRRIAFYSKRNGRHDVYVMNADGSAQRNVSHRGQARNGFFSWSPR